ncbi:acyl-CoA thioesterase [Paraglaciecola sp. L3A3]|uniref:acyl-CoA thioesterase n=1 Tax=Paraglaciecola sp. L3A3 TaxID=2686358 RepID=UPI00131CFB9C|nr:acyl-CoA thioesterase [Paraglaciecola sp. L3A3]
MDINQRRSLNFRFLAEPTDVNFGGKVHGGIVMKWMDQVGYACAAQWSGRYCVTVSIGGIRFKRPILVGQMVNLRAKIVHTGRTSMHIYIAVLATDPKLNAMVETGHCIMAFVASDEAGYPVEVPSWQPQTERDLALERYAIQAKESAQSLDKELQNTPKED